MVTVDKAIKAILLKNPDKYIHVVNEYDTFYAFMLLDRGQSIDDIDIMYEATIVDKRTGEIKYNVPIIDEMFKGNYKRLTL